MITKIARVAVIFFLTVGWVVFADGAWNWKTPKGDLDVLLDSGHIQGMCCDETGVYFSYAGGITKFDWQAHKLAETTGPSHLGDSFAYKGKVYAAFALRQPKTVDGKTMRGMIGVYDAATLKLEKSKLFDSPMDGCCVINDVIFSSPDPRGKNGGKNETAFIRRFDLDLNDLGTTELDFGIRMHYGIQTMATDGTNLFCCCYGGPDNVAVVTPDLKVLGTFLYWGAEGFCRVPELVVKSTGRPLFVRVSACGGNMQGWRKDPTNNPPQVALLLGTLPKMKPLLPPLTVEYAGKDPAVAFAARELRTCLKGARGTICFDEDASLAPQEWRIDGKNGVLTLYGRDGQGQVYAAYSFLEKYAGCRWYAPDTSVLPDKWGWRLPDVSAQGRPAMLDREMYVAGDTIDGTWRLRNKETARVAFNCGYSIGSPRNCHTFGVYHEEIKDKLTPEMMGRKADGKPSGQFCPSHPTVRHLVAERMKDYIRSDRAARSGKPRYTWPTVYELSQDDGNAGRCQCPVCTKLCAAAGGRGSASNLAFASAVAEEVGKEFPDVIVRTFAYAYTEQAPENEFVAADNLAIRYCRSFLFQPLTEETDNGRMLLDWSRHVKLKQVWSYWRSFSGPLFPSVKPREDIGKEMRFCRGQNVFGYFAEDESPLSRSFAYMQHWIFLKLTENPDLDVWQLSEEFMKAYYGKAASAVGNYLAYLERREKENYAALDRDFVRGLDSGKLAMYVQREYLDRAFFETANRFLDEAERLASSDERSARHVAHERLIVDRALVENALEIGISGDSPDFISAVRRIRRTVPELVAHWTFSPKDRAERLEKARIEGEIVSRLPAPVPPELKGRAYVEWPCNKLAESGIVKDPDSVFGYALTFPKAKHRLPYRAGAYDPITRQNVELMLEAKDIPADGKYHLYRLGTLDLVCESRVYYEWTWGKHTWVPPFGIPMGRREVWLSVKLTGPTYVNGSADEDGIFIERVLFATPDEGFLGTEM